MAARLLMAAGEDLEELIGRHALRVAIGELEAPYDPRDIATEATRQGDGWSLTGRKSVV